MVGQVGQASCHPPACQDRRFKGCRGAAETTPALPQTGDGIGDLLCCVGTVVSGCERALRRGACSPHLADFPIHGSSIGLVLRE
eukprot:4162785-Pyramimonas_sp.AAC.1